MMKIVTSSYAKLLWLTSTVVLIVPLMTASAQSGRTVQPPPPTPAPQTAMPKQPDDKPKFVIDVNADKYKLVFPLGYEGRRFYVAGKNVAELERAVRSVRDNFIEQLNKAGAQGYRLISATNSLSGIMKLDEAQYEYAWFATTSNLFFAKIGFEENYTPLAKQGYRVVDHIFLSRLCEMDGPTRYTEHGVDTSFQTEQCEYNDLFLLEREKGFETAREYKLLSSVPRWGGKPSVELSSAIGEHLAKGFYPTRLFSQFEILLEPVEKQDEQGLTERPEVQVIRSSEWRDNLWKRVNELAKQGYRLALTNDGVAVMYRADDGAPSVSYIELDATKKNFKKQLAELASGGAIYRMTYPNGKITGTENKLVFEQRLANNGGERREYKVLEFEFQNVENNIEKRVQTNLAPSSKETLKQMNELAKEGFILRDLFISRLYYSDKVSVLLER